MYHGTERKRGQDMISKNHMKKSVGDYHWLGDGVYFYQEHIYAFRWIYKMYVSRYKDEPSNYDDLIKKYMIIEAELVVEDGRIFSFSNIEHKLLFDSVVSACNEKKRFEDEIIDGAVINLMFNEMKYGKEYDIVEAPFIHKDKVNSELNLNSRLNYLPEIQICVKNISVIKKCREYDSSSEGEKCMDFSMKYSSLSGPIINTNIYKRNNPIKYKKRGANYELKS